MMWIPIVGWVLAPLLFLAALVAWASAILPRGQHAYQCQDCKKWFRVPKTAQ